MRHIIVVALVAAAAGCGSRSPAPGARDTREANEAPSMAGMDMGGDGPIRVTTRQAALAGATFAVAREGPVNRTVRAVSMAVPNERGQGAVNARVSGWVEELYANETGRFVRRGAPLLALYAPDLVTAQEELLLAGRLPATPERDTLVVAARRRLARWGVGEEDIAAIEASGAARTRLTIRSPYSGHILDKQVIEGQMVRPGEPLFSIADLSTIWIEPAIFESDIPLVRVGQRADITFDALPGRRFGGRVTFIHPALDMRTRTLKVRIEVPNPGLLVKPMMYGAVRITAGGPRGVIVPLGAVLPTGTRDLVFVVRDGGVLPTEVVVGARGDSTVLVADGLAPGDTVIASATFLFDSESNLAAAMAGIMLNMGMGLDMGGMPTGASEGMDMPGMNMPRAPQTRPERRP